jgi:hypothetical protein
MWKLKLPIRLFLILGIWAAFAALRAQELAGPAVNSQIRQVSAIVQAIDLATREVRLSGARGRFTVVVSPEVNNLDKVHVGDKVDVSYYEGAAAQIAKGGRKVTAPMVSKFATPAQGGARPGGLRGKSVTTRVLIEDIDPGTNTVAFKRSDGTVHIIAVTSPNMRKFISTLKPGDSVDVTYTESVAVNVVPSTG